MLSSKSDLRSYHLTRWQARRVRYRWIRSVSGRDAYILRMGRFHWECRRLENIG